LGQGRGGRGQPLAVDGHVVRHRHAEEWTFAREGTELLRLLPRQAAAEDASAAPELHRHEIIVGGGKPRAGKAHEHTAIFDPARKRLTRLGYIAYVREDQHPQTLLDELT